MIPHNGCQQIVLLSLLFWVIWNIQFRGGNTISSLHCYFAAEGAWKRLNEHYAPSDPWPSHSWVIRKPAICYLHDLLMTGCDVTKVGGAAGSLPSNQWQGVPQPWPSIWSSPSYLVLQCIVQFMAAANITSVLLIHITLLTKFKNNVLPAVMITRF